MCAGLGTIELVMQRNKPLANAQFTQSLLARFDRDKLALERSRQMPSGKAPSP
jgi:hypothetical protein